MNKVVITAWMGMTVRNILFSPVIENLKKNFNVNIFHMSETIFLFTSAGYADDLRVGCTSPPESRQGAT